jgi:hypothetical protein
VIATISGSITPVEIRKIAQLASKYEWQSGPPQRCPRRYGKYTCSVLENFVPRCDNWRRALRANSNALGAQTKNWRLIVQYGESEEAIDRLTAEQRRVTLEAGTERPFTVISPTVERAVNSALCHCRRVFPRHHLVLALIADFPVCRQADHTFYTCRGGL